ncbi:MAG: EAL domain-containing protein [Pseudomonadota bacterium]|nr:EAL domain-containing protein [Pseudomonadota bacterium]
MSAGSTSSPLGVSLEQMESFTMWLVALAAGIALILLVSVLAAWLHGLYRSRNAPGKRAQQALSEARSDFRRVFQTQRESESRLLHSMAGAGFGAWSVDLVSGQSWRSPQYERIFGYEVPLASWTLAKFLDHVLPEDRPGVERVLAQSPVDSMDGVAHVSFECRIRRGDGEIRWIQAQGSRELEGPSSSIIFGLVHDITSRKEADELLRESRNRLAEKEQRLAEAQQIARVGSWDLDFVSKRLSTSDELCRIYGLPPGCFDGSFERMLDVVHPDDREEVKAAIEEAVRSRRPFVFEHRIVQPGGDVRLIQAHGRVITDAQGTASGLAGTVHDVTERQAAQERLHRLAHYDPLTGLPNRRLFYESLGREMEVAHEQGLGVALLYLDLDQFKAINDTLGHSVGDELLRQVAQRLLACTRIRDTVGRLGGDEFGLVAITAEGSDDIVHMAEKIIETMQQAFDLAGHRLTVTTSIGIALYPTDSTDCETLVKFADIAMYHAKSVGRNTYRFYTSSMNVRARARVQLETDLRNALEAGEFVLHYQPEIDIHSGEWTGAEALLRWNRPGHGLVLPSQFVPALEESGLIVPVGRWVIEAACQQLSKWHHAGVAGVSLSVNVSAKQMLSQRRSVDHREFRGSGNGGGGSSPAHGVQGIEVDGICEHVDRCTRRYRIQPGSLRLELTETALMSNADQTLGELAKLKNLGIQILVDDFGTGYSSMSYLKRFPIDTLKIDREFVRDLPHDGDDRAITRAMINLAHSLKLKVIAEGVETREQLDFLQDEGCDRAQGFYIAHPMPGPELLKLFLDQGAGLGDFSERQPSLFGRGIVPARRTLQ